MEPFSDADEHERGAFLEYAGVEPERLSLLERAAALAGEYGTLDAPGDWARLQAECAPPNFPQESAVWG